MDLQLLDGQLFDSRPGPADSGVVDQHINRLAGEPPAEIPHAALIGDVESLDANVQGSELARLRRLARGRDHAIPAAGELARKCETQAPVGSRYDISGGILFQSDDLLLSLTELIH